MTLPYYVSSDHDAFYSGLLFAYFPNKIHHQPGSGISLARPHSGSSSEERERTPEAVESTAQPSGTNSYSELGDGQVMEILEKHLKSYNDNSNCEGQELGGRTAESAQSQKMDLVLFKGSIEHAARLCRSMVRRLYNVNVVHNNCCRI